MYCDNPGTLFSVSLSVKRVVEMGKPPSLCALVRRLPQQTKRRQSRKIPVRALLSAVSAEPAECRGRWVEVSTKHGNKVLGFDHLVDSR
jgi:hypothetical protein